MVAAADSRFHCPNCGARLRDLPTPEAGQQLTECDRCMCDWVIHMNGSETLTFVKTGPDGGLWPKRTIAG
jgi:hypothetical protein